jgi:uncharacterized protein
MIDVEELERGPKAFDCEIPLEWLAAELEACEYPVKLIDGRLEAVASRADAGVLVRGEATAHVRTECGTCLDEVVLELRAPLSAFLMPRSDAPGDAAAESTPDELEREWYDGDELAIDGLVRDSIVLELPMTPRCEGECQGEAAAHLARKQEKIDPRLAPLANIRLVKEK